MTTLQEIIDDLSPDIDGTIAGASVRVAQGRADKVSEVSGGAVQTTPEQLDAMRTKAADEMYSTLREQLASLFRVYTINVTHAPVE